MLKLDQPFPSSTFEPSSTCMQSRSSLYSIHIYFQTMETYTAKNRNEDLKLPTSPPFRKQELILHSIQRD